MPSGQHIRKRNRFSLFSLIIKPIFLTAKLNPQTMKFTFRHSIPAAIACIALFSACSSDPKQQGQENAAIAQLLSDTLPVDSSAQETLVFEGLLPAASGPGIVYNLHVSSPRHSGDGTFRLSLTYKEAEDGQDKTFTYSGRRYTQRGIPGHNDATVWQMVTDDKQEIFNFLLQDRETLILLNDQFEVPQSKQNYALTLKE